MRNILDIPIEDLINRISDREKRVRTLKAYDEYKNLFEVEPSTIDDHQSYEGGLSDHTKLVALISILTVEGLPTPIFMLFSMDDIIIASIFHDFDKLGKNVAKSPFPIFQTHMDVVEYLDEHGLNNSSVRDGILHSHGGWGAYRNEDSGPTGALIHYADMIATKVIKSEEKTKRMITELVGFLIRR